MIVPMEDICFVRMSIFRKKWTLYHGGRLLLCLLFCVLTMWGWSRPAYCDIPAQPINSAGNLNISPSVDPFRQGESFSAVLYDNRSGLPTSEANAIAHTDDGFIWIGSYAGLICYDGKTFERIDADIPISNVKVLFKDSRNRLWIGTNDAGVLMMENGQFMRWGRADGLESLTIRNFAEDKDGYIYIGTISGIAFIDPELKFTVDSNKQIEGSIHNLRTGADGVVYALTREGDLAGFEKGKRVSLISSEDNPIENVNCMLPDPENPGWFWLGDMGSSLYYGEASKAFQDARVLDLGELTEPEGMEAIGGRIWVCARNGIGRLDEDGITLLNGVPMDNSVQHVMTDYQGNLWFTSTRQGVMKIVPNQFVDMFERWQMPAQVINSTCLYDSMLLLGTDEGLIAMQDGDEVTSIPLTKAVTASGKSLEATDLLSYLDMIRIRSIMQDSRGYLWISTWNGDGLIRYFDGEIMVFTPEDGIPSEKCRTISECTDGSILAALSGGLCVIRDDRITEVYEQEDGLTNNAVLTVTEGFGEEYVLGTDGGGLLVIRQGEITHFGTENGLESDVVMRVSRSRSEDVIWIVTGNSLAYMTPDYTVTTIRKFPYANNYDLYENSRGELWVLSSDGIYVASVEQLLANEEIETVHYDLNNGLHYVATANSFSELTEDGDLYIAGTNGVIKVNIDTPYKTDVDLRMAVPFVEVDGFRVWPDSEGEFTIPPYTHKLTVRGYVLNYAPLNPKVSCYLQGFDRSPTTVNLSNLTSLDYTNLQGGKYHFIMRLDSGAGEESNKISVLISKKPAFYEQLWFWFLIALFALLLNMWLVRLFLKRQALQIEKRKDEERIAGDLRLASEIQSSALPHTSLSDSVDKKYDLYASMTPAKDIGGDFYDYFLVDDDHLAMVIADVSGKGVPAALFMMVAKALIKNQLMTGLTPAEAMTNVNVQLCENNESGMFVTVWAAVLEISTGRGIACNAGHEHPAIRRSDGSFELLKYKHNMFAGVMDKAKYQNREFEMNPGDCLFVYTDGIIEAKNTSGEMFGEERLIDALNQIPDAEPKELLDNVQKAIALFTEDVPQFDDITMLSVRYRGRKEADQITVNAQVNQVKRVTRFVNEHLKPLGCSERTRVQIDVAIDEIFSNIANYAYVPETGSVTIKVEVDENPLCAAITFIDQGIPFDPFAEERPDTTRLPAKERPIGGLGLFMVQQTMDDVSYEYKDGQNILTIRKKI